MRAGALHLRIVLSRKDHRGASDGGALVWSPGPRRPVTAGLQALARVNAEGRYAREMCTTYPRPHFAAGPTYDASEVVEHNDPARSCSMIVDGRVYDLTRFARLQPA